MTTPSDCEEKFLLMIGTDYRLSIISLPKAAGSNAFFSMTTALRETDQSHVAHYLREELGMLF